MTVKLIFDGQTTIHAVVADIRRPDRSTVVATGRGATVQEAVKALVSRFAEMQHETIKALNDSGIVHYVEKEVEVCS